MATGMRKASNANNAASPILVAIYLVTRSRPQAGPPGPRASFAERLATLRRSVVIVGIVLATIGGIYLGVFTPVEAAGVGACLTLVMAMAEGKKLTDWKIPTEPLQI